MARKPTAKTSAIEDPVASTEVDLENAIDDLRGALKADETGTILDTDSDIFASTGSDFGAPAGDFGDFGGSTDFGATADLGASSDFGGSDFGGASDFGGGADFGGSNDFGGGFGSSAASSSSSHADSHFEAPRYDADANQEMIMDIPIDVQIVLGASRMPVKGLMSLKEGTTITLDKKIGEPVDITVNGRLIARGEITLLEDDDTRFGVKLTELAGAAKS